MSTREKKKEPRTKMWGARLFFFFLLVSCLLPLEGQAQCAMCRAALESEASGVQAGAVNDGIVYLMIIPYILVAAMGYAIYKLKYGKKKDKK